MSRTHSDIREVRVEADGVVIADVIQQQLVKRIIDFNYVTDAYPQYIMTFKTGETTLKNAAAKSGTKIFPESGIPADGSGNKLVLT